MPSVRMVSGSIPADFAEKKTNFLLFCKGEPVRFIMLPSPLLFLFVALIAVREKKVNINNLLLFGSFHFAMPAKRVRDSKENPERQDSQGSLTNGFGDIVLNDGEGDGSLPKKNQVAVKTFIFLAYDGNRFSPQNTTFVFNPLSPSQVEATDEKIEKLKAEAIKAKVQFHVMDFLNTDAPVLITKVGGASPDFISKKFSVDEKWVIGKKKEEPHRKMARRSSSRSSVDSI